MDARDLPPLSFLPAFEAAGRLGSFKAAASELRLTPSAISQQIKALEDALGLTLFTRAGRTAALTSDGELYLREVRGALSELASVGRRLRKRARARVLRVSTVPLFAHEFLLSRLPDFRACFPGLELSVEGTMQAVDFSNTEVDAAIRVGDGEWPGLRATPLGAVETAPVCAPALAESILRPADLCAQTIILVRGQERRCEPLLKSWGVSMAPSDVVTFETCFEALRAAEHGLGVALGIFPIATEWVTSGRLAVPLVLRQPLPGHAFLLHRSGDSERFPFAEIAGWLQSHYLALPSLPAGRIVPARSVSRLQRV